MLLKQQSNKLEEKRRIRINLFKSAVIKKTSELMVLMLLLSVLTPVLAFAEIGLNNVTYNKYTGNVSGSVYSNVNGSVSINLYSPSNSTTPFASMSKATYNSISTATGATYYYNFNFNGVFNYNSITLNASNSASSTVSSVVYSSGANNSSGSVSTGGGGGGGAVGGTTSTGSTSSDVMTVGVDGKVDAKALDLLLKAYPNATLKLTGDYVLIPAAALSSGKMLIVTSANGTYYLPVNVLKLTDLAKALGIDVKDLLIKVSFTKLTGDAAKAVQDAIKALGGVQIADAIDFNVVAVGKDNKVLPIDFGNTYVARSLTYNKVVDTKKITGVLYNEMTKKIAFEPASFETKDGKNIATLKRVVNSIYTVAEFNKSFTDLNSHWAKADIEYLANKLVVEGITDTTFEADRSITRAEFTSLVVRALGLNAINSTTTYFSDVKADTWYASAVATAIQVGVINGYEDHTFHPNANITREEIIAMVIRAAKYAGQETSISTVDQASQLAKFKDSNAIVWGQTEVAVAIKAGIINGITDTMLGTKSNATRAQAVAMLKRFLSNAGFIN